MKLKETLLDKVDSYELGHMILTDPEYKSMAFAVIGLDINIAFALYNGYLGLRHFSWWFLTMFVYHSVLAVARFLLVRTGLRDDDGGKTDIRMMRVTGEILIILTFVLGGTVILSRSMDVVTHYSLYTIIILAAYTFFKLISAIVSVTKSRLSGTPLMQSINAVKFAAVFGSLLSLTRSMNAVFAGDAVDYAVRMNSWVGLGACVLVFGLGVALTVRYHILTK